MILNDEEVKERLESPENLVNKLTVIKTGGQGKKDGNTDLDSKMRALISSVASKSDEKLADVAAAFDVSTSSVSNYRRGLLHTSFDRDLAEQASKAKEAKELSAHDEALDVMVGCLGELKTRVKSINDPRDLSKIAVDMSKVVGSIKGKDSNFGVSNVNVVVMAPAVKEEKFYETVLS